MARSANLETEIKLRLEDPAATRRQLAGLGFSVSRRRVLEINTIFDTPGGALRRERKLLRLRQAGSRRAITFKGPPAARVSAVDVEPATGEFTGFEIAPTG